MIYRPLIFGIIEYLLALGVLKYGKFERKMILLFLFFLGSYQIGEAIILLTEQDMFGLKFAYFSTTLLPAFGIYFIEKLTKKDLKSELFFMVSVFLATLFVAIPAPVNFIETVNCILKVFFADNDSLFYYIWLAYYFISLILGIGFLIYYIYHSHDKEQRKYMFILLIAYLAFFPTSVILVLLFKISFGLLASTMCAMAIVTGILISYMSLRFKND